MDRTIIKFLFFIQSILACSCNRNEIIIQTGIEISKKIVFLNKSDAIVYSSNEQNYFRPFILLHPFDTNFKRKQAIALPDTTLDYLVQSSSFDERYISLLAEHKSEKKFGIFLYDLHYGSFSEIPKTENAENGCPVFSPVGSNLAFISDGNLVIYNYITQNIEFPPSISVDPFTNLVWSEKGRYIFINDTKCNIFRFEIMTKKWKKIINGPHITNDTQNQITPIKGIETDFYFVSDKDTTSQFSQIYRYKEGKPVSLVVNSPFDKFLFQRLSEESKLDYRIADNGDYYRCKWSSNGVTNTEKKSGVLYDFFMDRKGREVSLFADFMHPASLYLSLNTKLISLIDTHHYHNTQVPQKLINSGKMFNLVYSPVQKAKGWLLWLHGGPHEQVSNRFNPYFNALVQQGWGVIVLNYPGSTGAGNSYELASGNLSKSIDYSLTVIMHDLKQIRTLYRINQPVDVLGVSYGSILAHSLCCRFPGDFRSLIDFSGIYIGKTNPTIRSLYIYGKNDFAIDIIERKKLLKEVGLRSSTTVLVLPDEGHIINRKNNNLKILKEIVNYLNR